MTTVLHARPTGKEPIRTKMLQVIKNCWVFVSYPLFVCRTFTTKQKKNQQTRRWIHYLFDSLWRCRRQIDHSHGLVKMNFFFFLNPFCFFFFKILFFCRRSNFPENTGFADFVVKGGWFFFFSLALNSVSGLLFFSNFKKGFPDDPIDEFNADHSSSTKKITLSKDWPGSFFLSAFVKVHCSCRTRIYGCCKYWSRQ